MWNKPEARDGRVPAALWDLTPLLDVIFIILFLVMQRSGAAARASQQEAEEAMNALERSEAAYSILAEDAAAARGLLDSYELLRQSALCVSLQVLRSPESPGERELLLSYGEGETRSIPLTWDTMDTASRRLRNTLEELANSAGDAPVFIRFSFDSAAIYRRDYELADNALQALSRERNNIYLRYIESEP